MHRKSRKLISSLLVAAILAVLMPFAPSTAAVETDRFVSISSSDTIMNLTHFLAIGESGSLWAWGRNNDGQIGNGVTGNTYYSPVHIMDDVVFAQAMSGRSIALRQDKSLWIWGSNEYGQLGDGTRTPRNSPYKVMDDVLSVFPKLESMYVIKTDGSLWAWGHNNRGQLGNGKAYVDYIVDSNPPQTYELTPVKIMDNVSTVHHPANGFDGAYAIKNDGSLWAWGNNNGGVLGDGSNETRYEPVRIMDGVSSFVSDSTYLRMAIKTDGSLWAWGRTLWSYTGVGDGTTERRPAPIKIMDDVSSVYISASRAFAIKTDESLWAWGDNEYGQLGDGTNTLRLTPVKIMDGVENFSGIGALKIDGSLWVWAGHNADGTLGGSLSEGDLRHMGRTPVKILDDIEIAIFSASQRYALKNDGSLYGWGFNRQYANVSPPKGYLGDGTTDTSRSPIRIMDDVSQILAGENNTHVIKADGSIWGWGDIFNPFEQSVSNSLVPVQISQTVSSFRTLSITPITDETNLNVTVGVKLSWDSVPGVERYDIYRARQGGGYELLADGINGNTYVDLDIEPGATYTYKICPAGGNPDDTTFSETTVTTGPESAPLLPDEDGNMGPANGYILMQINNPMMDVNGETVEVDPVMGTAPMLYRERTMLPIRAVVEAMGGTVGWDPDESKVTLEGNGNAVVMWIGNMNYTVNGTPAEMDIAPFIDNWRTFLPLRFAAENLNCRVTWINATREILIVWNAGN